MTGMTPERLDLIRDRIDHTGYAPWKNVTSELLDEVDRLRVSAARLYDVATFALPHIDEFMCPDPHQPDKRDPSCDACNALIDPTEEEGDG